METHKIHGELLRRQVRILVVGCGGTGSAIAAGLPHLHFYAMLACCHPGGLHVTLMDGDMISPTNSVPPAVQQVRNRALQARGAGEPHQHILGIGLGGCTGSFD